ASIRRWTNASSGRLALAFSRSNRARSARFSSDDRSAGFFKVLLIAGLSSAQESPDQNIKLRLQQVIQVRGGRARGVRPCDRERYVGAVPLPQPPPPLGIRHHRKIGEPLLGPPGHGTEQRLKVSQHPFGGARLEPPTVEDHP